jgi:hypothetical protein
MQKFFKVGVIGLLNFNIAFAQSFFPVGGGANNTIYCLYADTANNILYTGGSFSMAGNIPSNCVARWNGFDWDSLNNNLAGATRSISKFNNDLYIGGGFSSFDTSLGQWQVFSGLIKLDSINHKWIAPDSNLNGNVFGILNYNNSLYIEGNFDSAGGIYSSKIARYDGTNFYSFPTLDGTGGGWAITDAINYNGDLYVGGNFDSQIASNMKDVAKWNGSQWLSVGNGLSGQLTWINDFAIYQGKLIIAGFFNTSSGDPGNGVAAWDGFAWSQLDNGVLPGQVFSLKVYNGELWAGGAISSASGTAVSYLAKWDGTQWHSLGITLDNVVTSMAVLGNDLYIAGAFWTMDGDSVHHIIRYSSPTGFETLETDYRKIEISPNPFTSSLSITLQKQNINQATISIKNILGQTVYRQERKTPFSPGEGSGVRLDLSFLSKGIYLMEVVVDPEKNWTGGERMVRKIIKE